MFYRRFASCAFVPLLACSLIAGCASTPEPLNLDGISMTQITAGEYTFDARVAGPEDGELVLLLHGFPETSLEWRAQLQALAQAGYRAVAPDQRGYSTGARPTSDAAYAYANLVDDALAIADALGAKRFHLVGHDWGASVSWGVAAKAPERVRTLTTFSIPHPDAFAAALADKESCQYKASDYFDTFTDEAIAGRLLMFDAFLMRRLVYGDLPPAAVEGYLDVLGTEAALHSALGWYRANIKERQLQPDAVGPVSVDTLFIWSADDEAVCRDNAESTAKYVTGEYRFETVNNVDHWIPERAPDVVNPWLLEHIRAHPIEAAADVAAPVRNAPASAEGTAPQ